MLETERLTLSRLSYDDAQFIFDLVNEPAFKQFIGVRKVHTLDDAKAYLRNGPMDNYEKHGFGLYLVCLRENGTPVGICGLVKREDLEFPDLGFAFLQAYWSNGFAHESSVATIGYAREQLGLSRIIAIVNGDNRKSISLLKKLGFGFEKMTRLRGESADICRYALDL